MRSWFFLPVMGVMFALVAGAADEAVPGGVGLLLNGNGQESAKSLVLLINNEKLLLDSLDTVLPNIDNVPSEMDVAVLVDPDNLPRWVGITGVDIDAMNEGTRARVTLRWYCHCIREATPGADRDEAYAKMFQFLTRDVGHGDAYGRLSLLADLYFWPGGCVSLEGGFEKLLSFVEDQLSKESRQPTLSAAEKRSLETLLTRCLEGGPFQVQKAYSEKYSSVLSARFLSMFQMGPIRRDPLPEPTYRLYYTYTPEQLVGCLSDKTVLRPGGDMIVARFLAGTQQLRRENFELLLPLIRQSKSSEYSLLEMYCNFVSEDARAEDKQIQDAIINVLEQRMKDGTDPDCPRLLGRLVLQSGADTEVPERPYALGRVVELLRWQYGQKGAGPLQSGTADNAKSALAAIMGRFPEVGDL